MDARTGRRQKRISRKQEENIAAKLGGRTQANSGATRLGGGGDVRVRGKMRVECKYTEGREYVLKLADLDKLKKHANSAAEQPVFLFEFRSPGSTHPNSAYVVTFGIEDVPQAAPCKVVQTYARQVIIEETDIGQIFAKKNDSLLIQFFDEEETWCRSFRIRPWADFIVERGEEDV